eukprot:TRINITY_DN25093_c0_g1_i1.p1 TRINITY_DN25093_c0_g1~~TRINITY_DN25093_c0_g1_i1.p1  ORF type:complete len:1236 (+),score=398.71 TRINITY_DN25093_c0_g1_i1:151-3858(+)
MMDALTSPVPLFTRSPSEHQPDLSGLRLFQTSSNSSIGQATQLSDSGARTCGRGPSARQGGGPRRGVAAAADARAAGASPSAGTVRVPATKRVRRATLSADGQWLSAPAAVRALPLSEAADLLALKSREHARDRARANLKEREARGLSSGGVEALSNPGPRAMDTQMEVVGPGGEGFAGTPFAPLDPEKYSGDEMGRKLLFQWYRCAKDEEATFSSTSIWAGAVHRQLLRATQSLPSPSLLRTAASCLLLVKVLAELSGKQAIVVAAHQHKKPHRWNSNPTAHLKDDLSVNKPDPRIDDLLPECVSPPQDDEYTQHERGTLLPLLRALLNDVFSAVWEGWGVSTPRPFERLLRDGDVEGVFNPLRLHASATSDVSRELENWRNTVDAHNTDLEQVRQRKVAVMQMEVDYWRMQLLKRVFKLWHAEARTTRQARAGMSSVLNRLANRVLHFTKWMAFIRLREYGVWSRGEKERHEYERKKRDWRQERADLQLDRSTLRADSVAQKRVFQETIDDLRHAQQQIQIQCQAAVDRLEEASAAAERQVRDIREQLEEARRECGRWALLGNKVLREVSGGNDRDHPFFALVTDRPRRRWERADLQKRIAALRVSDSPSGHQSGSAEDARDRERAVKEERRRRNELERLQRQLDDVGHDDADYDLIGDYTSIPEMLNTNHAVERVLLRFCNFMLERSGVPRATPVENFSADMQDSEVLITTMAALWPECCDLSGLSLANQHSRAVGVIDSLRAVGLEGLLSVDDILMGRGGRNMVFIGTLFRLYCVGSALGVTEDSGIRALLNDTPDAGEDEVVWETAAEKEARISAAAAAAAAASSSQDDLESRAATAVTAVTSPTRGSIAGSDAAPEEDSASESGTRRRRRRQRKRAPRRCTINMNYDEMSTVYAQHSRSNRGWLYLGETVSRQLVKILQTGRTREGDLLDLKAQRQMAAFTQLDFDRTQDLIEGDHNQGDELDLCQDVLANAYEDLRRVYQFYTTQEGCRRLPQSGLAAFFRDCKITRLVGKRELDAAVQKALRDGPGVAALAEPARTGRSEEGPADVPVSPAAFAELLLRIAVLRRGRTSTSRALQRLIDDVVLPAAAKSSVDDLKRGLRHPDVQKVVKRHQKQLQKMFRYFHTTGVTEDGERQLLLDEWLRVVKDLRLIDSKLSFADANHIFVNILYDETSDGRMGLTFSDFVDALCCLTIFKSPAPYMPLASRIDSYFRLTLFAKLRDRMRQGAST